MGVAELVFGNMVGDNENICKSKRGRGVPFLGVCPKAIWIFYFKEI